MRRLPCENEQWIRFVAIIPGSYMKNAVEAVTRPMTKTRALEIATAIPPFEPLCELLVLILV